MARTPAGPPDVRFTGKGRARPVPQDRGFGETYAGAFLGAFAGLLAAPLLAFVFDILAGGMAPGGVFLTLALIPFVAVLAAPAGVAVRLHGRGYTGVRRTTVALLLLLVVLAAATIQVGAIALICLPGIPAAARVMGRTAAGAPS